jgi:hypothetical protein
MFVYQGHQEVPPTNCCGVDLHQEARLTGFADLAKQNTFKRVGAPAAQEVVRC